jgi:hypothetical protein
MTCISKHCIAKKINLYKPGPWKFLSVYISYTCIIIELGLIGTYYEGKVSLKVPWCHHVPSDQADDVIYGEFNTQIQSAIDNISKRDIEAVVDTGTPRPDTATREKGSSRGEKKWRTSTKESFARTLILA